jgi:hypothetical protein
MMSKRLFKYLAITACVVSLVLVFQGIADAQCSMCRAVLSSSNNARFIRNFNLGVLVLLIPPVTIFCSIFIVLKRHGKETGQSGGSEQSRD